MAPQNIPRRVKKKKKKSKQTNKQSAIGLLETERDVRISIIYTKYILTVVCIYEVYIHMG